MKFFKTLFGGMKRTLCGGKPRRPDTRARLRLESLEDRCVPATLDLGGGILTYKAGVDVANVLRVDYSAGRYTFSDVEPIHLTGVAMPAGSGTNTVSFSDADIDSIAIHLLNRNDTLRLMSTADRVTAYGGDDGDSFQVGGYVIDTTYYGGSLDGILAPVSVHGEGGYDELMVNDWASPTLNTYTMTNTKVSRAAVSIAYDTGVEFLRLNEGFSNCTVNVESTSLATAVTINLKAGGADLVNIGGGANPSLDGILGPVAILGEVSSDPKIGAVDSVHINDQGDTHANTYTLAIEDFTRIKGTVARSGAALIAYYGGLRELVLNAGMGNDTINVHSTALLAPLTVNAGAGHDTINVGFKSSVADIRGRLHVNGQSGWDALVIDDRADVPTPFSIDAGPIRTVRRDGRILLTCQDVESITRLV